MRKYAASFADQRADTRALFLLPKNVHSLWWWRVATIVQDVRSGCAAHYPQGERSFLRDPVGYHAAHLNLTYYNPPPSWRVGPLGHEEDWPGVRCRSAKLDGKKNKTLPSPVMGEKFFSKVTEFLSQSGSLEYPTRKALGGFGTSAFV